MYLSYEKYKELGGTLNDTTFLQHEIEVEAKLDYLTNGRIRKLDTVPEAVINLCFKLNISFWEQTEIDGVKNITSYSNGIESFRRLLDNLNIDKINTLTQITPSGGYHYIFKSDDDLCQVLNTSNCFAGYPGIDCRTKGYIVVYPSKINEKEYRFINDIPPQPMPKALKDFILSTGISKKDSFVYKKPTKVLVGDRDNQMFQYILQMPDFHNHKKHNRYYHVYPTE